jgi:cytochrome c-type biogenesis protein CcmF
VLVDVGYYLLFGAVLLAAWAAGAFFLGGALRSRAWTTSGEVALGVTLAAVVVASIALVSAMVRGDYTVAYVAQVSDRSLPPGFKLTAFWAGMNGSMLLWLLVQAIYATVAVALTRRTAPELRPWIGFTLAACVLFFGVLVAFLTNPLERLPFLPADGKGMNPALQNYWMAIHPPTLYLGYVGLSVPFAFAVAALVTGRLDDAWIRAVRRWVLLAWGCLGLGMIFGGHWAYVELGWGGYWAWDPVENASLMPWLAATAFLHSVMVQERRGMFRAWNVVLVALAFILSIFGTFITRSGVVESVHSFARSAVGPFFLAFVVVLAAATVGLLHYRWPLLRAAHRIDSLLSREFSFMLNNLLFVSLVAATLFLTMWPSISELLMGERYHVGAAAYTFVNGSLGLLLLVLTGVGPVIAWRRASWRGLVRGFAAPVAAALATATVTWALGWRDVMSVVAWSGAAFVAWCILAELVNGARVVAGHRGTGFVPGLVTLVARNRRRYGGYVVHLGVAMLFVGAAGMAFREDAEAALRPGESIRVHGFDVTYAEAVPRRDPGADVHAVRLTVARGDESVTELRPEIRLHDKFPEAEKNVAIHQTAAGDLYAILARPLTDEDGGATIQVLWNPLVAWVWWAAYVMLLGTVICAWPDAPRAAAVAVKERAA